MFVQYTGIPLSRSKVYCIFSIRAGCDHTCNKYLLGGNQNLSYVFGSIQYGFLHIHPVACIGDHVSGYRISDLEHRVRVWYEYPRERDFRSPREREENEVANRGRMAVLVYFPVASCSNSFASPPQSRHVMSCHVTPPGVYTCNDSSYPRSPITTPFP
jgi:hypothetical protein